MRQLGRTVFRNKAWSVSVALAMMLATTLGYAYLGFPGMSGQTQAASLGTPVQTYTGTAPAGQRKQATLLNTAPVLTAQQRQFQQAAIERLHNLGKAPVGPIAKAAAQTAAQLGPQAVPSAHSASTAPGGSQINDTDFVIEQAVSTNGGNCCGAAGIMEPSIGSDGKHLMETANWFDAVSHNGGSTWGAINPYSLFDTSTQTFCCDQQVTYDPSRDTMIWESLLLGNTLSDPNSLELLGSPGTNLSGWCGWNITPSWFGLTNTNLLDYPDIAVGTDYLYLTFNVYQSQVQGSPWLGTYLMKIPLTGFSTCAGFSYWYVNTTANFSFTLVTGTLGNMFFASNWYTSQAGSGSSLRIFTWPECGIGACSPTFVDRATNAWNFTTGGQNCASQDGVVTNWCGRLDSRRGTAYLSKAGYRVGAAPYIGFAFSAGAGGGFPYPYVTRQYFQVAGMVYKGSDQIYNTGIGFAYPSMAANYRGYVGGSVAWGGGTGTTHYYPSTMLLTDDPITPSQPWTDYFFYGSGNTPGGWGDYNTTRAYMPLQAQWIAAGWYVSGSTVVPFEVIFGRGRDHNGYLRWIGA